MVHCKTSQWVRPDATGPLTKPRDLPHSRGCGGGNYGPGGPRVPIPWDFAMPPRPLAHRLAELGQLRPEGAVVG